LRIPGGWLLDAPRHSDQARLFSPQGTEVTVKVWSGETAATPEEAAVEYRDSLGLSEAAVRLADLTASDADGQPGCWMHVDVSTQAKPLLAFVTYTHEKTRVAVAVRGLPGFEAAARQRLEAICTSLSLTPTPTGAESFAVTPPVALPPATVPASTAEGLSLVDGFTLRTLPGWEVRNQDGLVEARDPQQPSGYFLWPVRVTGEVDLAKLPALWSAATGTTLEILATRPLGAGEVLAARVSGPIFRRTTPGSATAPVRAVLYVWRQGDTALVTGLYAPAAQWAEQAPRLAGQLSRAAAPGWEPATVAPEEAPRWTDNNKQLSLGLPAGWEAGGAVTTFAGQPTIALRLRSADYEVSWQQPSTPFFRDLSPILVSLGQAEGTPYREDSSEPYLTVLKRRTPEKYVEYLLAQPDETLHEAKVVSVQPSAAVAKLLPEGDTQAEGALVWVSGVREGKARERLYLCATGSLPLSAGAFRWQAVVGRIEYAPGQAAPAVRTLRACLDSFQGERPASDAGRALAQLLAGLKGVSVELGGLRGTSEPVTPLAGADFSPTALEGARWRVTPGLRAWPTLGDSQAAAPELAEAWWRQP
jgi:hypothetical protein